MESRPYHTVTANHLLQLIRKKESEHSHQEGSYSITHYLEDLPALLPFWLLSNVLKSVTQFSNTPAQTWFGRTHIHPLNSARQFLIAPGFSKKAWSFQQASLLLTGTVHQTEPRCCAWLNNCPSTPLPQAELCYGRIPKDSITKLLLRSAAVKKGKSTLWKKILFLKKPQFLKIQFCHVCYITSVKALCSDLMMRRVEFAPSYCLQCYFHQNCSAKSSGFFDSLNLHLPWQRKGEQPYKRGEKKTNNSHKSFYFSMQRHLNCQRL